MIRVILPKHSHSYRGRIYLPGEEHDIERRDLDSLRQAGETVVVVAKKQPPSEPERKREEIVKRDAPTVVQK